jgi:hypothetical protein
MTLFWLALPLLQQHDSESTLRSARGAQAAFESFRRDHLPESDTYSGHCDRNVGRYCFWYGDQEPDSVPEPKPIQEARARLLVRLADAAAALPGDDWIVGQAVRYLVEARRPRDAVAQARACRGTPWWCAALSGFALHAAGEFALADSAFAAGLAEMPQAERCRWIDISILLDGDQRSRYDRLSCDERAAFDRRWWWLAAPLLSRAGNDRRTEHYARLTLARLFRESHYVRDTPWGDDDQELLMRFGPEVFYTRKPSSALAPSDPVITGHERVPAFEFAPSARAFDAPWRAEPADWDFARLHPPDMYAPAYADRFAHLDAQLATFRRGDSCLVVARYDASTDPTIGHQDARAALALSDGEHAPVVRERETHLDGPEVLKATAPCTPQIASVEIVSAKGRWVARARRGIEPGTRERVSDLLIVDAADSLSTDFASILTRAGSLTRVPVDSRLGLFWETYGLPPDGEPVTISVRITAQTRAWLGRAAESIGLASRRRGVGLQWDEVLRPPGPGAPTPRLLTIDLAGLGPGRYRVELSMNIGGGVPVTATREIELVRP